MIARITGQIIDIEDHAVVVDTNGLGYRIAVLATILEKVHRGDKISLRIHHHMSSDNQTLYGFTDNQHLTYFQLLLTVPSVGPRTALNILDAAPPATLAQAVSAGDITLLTKVSGVGRKTAERILVELKEKISTGETSAATGNIQHETISALINLGFTAAQARDVVGQLPPTITTVEEAVRAALKAKQN